ncbi:MAG TPA: 1-phosphofructokinase family hexose kinase [Candidatus Koribacter sp.]|jgi:1-phosphofructokinase family hexose kinase
MNSSAPKLLCVSLNPAVDRRLILPSFKLGIVNRATAALPAAGGKGGHVSYAAQALGADVTWLAFTGGSEGDFCQKGIASRGIRTITVPIAARTRMTLEIIDESSRDMTEILEPGPSISDAERDAFLTTFRATLNDHHTVIMSGSLPENLPKDFYAELITIASDRGCTAFLDTSGEPLALALKSAPHAIKPNRQEAEALLHCEIRSRESALQAANDLRSRGPHSVILSLGSEGAIFVSAHEQLYAKPPKVEAISAIASGDSFLAGFAFAHAEHKSAEECLRLAVACGAANCLAPSPAFISRTVVDRFFPQVQIERI